MTAPVLRASALACLAAMTLAAAPAAFAAVPAAEHPAVQRALAHLGGNARDAALASPQDSFEASDLILDADGTEHVRFKRRYQGLAVIGGDLVVHSRNGHFDSISQTLAQRVSVTIEPQVADAEATALALKTFARPDGGVKSRQLVIYAREGAPRLAWDVKVAGTGANGVPSRMHLIVDARRGTLLDRWDDIQTIETGSLEDDALDAAGKKKTKKLDDIGVGHALYYGTVELHDLTNKKAVKFTLKDKTRGGHYVVDMGNTTTTETVFQDSDNVWGDSTKNSRETVAADAAYGQNMTWDFYKNVLGRNGIANDGNGAYSRVHYGTRVDNAYWDDECYCMMYGDGFIQFNPLVALDVAGHEMSHGVTSTTAGLIYSGESGGLNEGTSDIMGSMVEYYANNSGDPGDYTIGETIMRKAGAVLRSMYAPSSDGISADCWYSGVANLNPHYSSGVTNHFYYLLAEGSAPADGPASKTCKIGDTTKATGNAVITGIGRDKATKIWYRALSVYMTASETFAQARANTIKAAEDLYGAGSAESQAVAAAWTAVNRP